MTEHSPALAVQEAYPPPPVTDPQPSSLQHTAARLGSSSVLGNNALAGPTSPSAAVLRASQPADSRGCSRPATCNRRSRTAVAPLERLKILQQVKISTQSPFATMFG